MQAQTQTPPAPDFAAMRQTAVDCQIRPFGVTDQALLARFLVVPREIFVPAAQESLIYSDAELRHPLQNGGTRPMLAPLVLARLMQAANIGPSDAVLDVGGATGYTAALAAGLAGRVVALESDAGLSAAAARNFAALGLANVAAQQGALRDGAPGKGPFDVILVNGMAEAGLDGLIAQLAPGGRLLTLRPQTAGAGRAFIYLREETSVSERPLLEATGKILDEFAKSPGFVF